MLAHTPSNLKMIGAGLTGLGAAAAFIFAPAGTKAQTLAANVHEERLAAMAVCDGIRDPTERVGCRAAASIRFDEARTVVADQIAGKAKQDAAADRKETVEIGKRIATADVRIAEMQKGTAEIRTGTECMRILGAAVEGKRATADDVNGAFRRPTVTADPCIAVGRLQLGRQ